MRTPSITGSRRRRTLIGGAYREHHAASTMLKMYEKRIEVNDRFRSSLAGWRGPANGAFGANLLSTSVPAKARKPPKCEAQVGVGEWPQRVNHRALPNLPLTSSSRPHRQVRPLHPGDPGRQQDDVDSLGPHRARYDKTRGSNTTEIRTGCDLSTACAWGGTQHLQAGERLAHHPAAAGPRLGGDRHPIGRPPDDGSTVASMGDMGAGRGCWWWRRSQRSGARILSRRSRSKRSAAISVEGVHLRGEQRHQFAHQAQIGLPPSQPRFHSCCAMIPTLASIAAAASRHKSSRYREAINCTPT